VKGKNTGFITFLCKFVDEMMSQLNLPAIEARLQDGKNGRNEIFDPVRKKFVALTPEEWVRQHVIHYLAGHLDYPLTLIAVEAPLLYHTRKKRSDIVVFTRSGKPILIVECKAPEVAITQAVFEQAAMYNMGFRVKYLVLTNGIVHHACRIDHAAKSCIFLPGIPAFDDLEGLPSE
jgi:hypothetical protein